MARHVVRALLHIETDHSPDSHWLPGRGPDRPVSEREAFIAGFGWVKPDGWFLSGWDNGSYFHHDPSFIDRWQIRRAMREWAKRRQLRPQ